MAGTRLPLRPAAWLALLLLGLALLDGVFCLHSRLERKIWLEDRGMLTIVTAALGLSDLCLATEARYTRNPAISDPVAPFMDHPGGLEHFPTGSFWASPPRPVAERQQ